MTIEEEDNIREAISGVFNKDVDCVVYVSQSEEFENLKVYIEKEYAQGPNRYYIDVDRTEVTIDRRVELPPFVGRYIMKSQEEEDKL